MRGFTSRREKWAGPDSNRGLADYESVALDH